MNNKDQQLIELKDLSPEEFHKWQTKLLDTLVYFAEFCEEHHLRYYLASGTCIGAIRHHGFIPWDDDVDVAMPRKDYDQLPALWEKYADKSKFVCCKSNKEQCQSFPMIVIRNAQTTCIYPHSKDMDICHGVKIDIEHLDGVPTNKFLRWRQYQQARLLCFFRAQRVPNKERYSPLIKTLAKVLLVVFPTNRIRCLIGDYLENQIKKYDFEKSEYVRYLACALRPRKAFDKAEYVDFEGYKMPVPVGYDEFLTAEYGDYMTPPPVEKRFPETKVLFYDLDHGYQQYKGINYCVEK